MTRSRTPTYVSWASIAPRCGNPNHPAYPRYGGRGITVCERWASFENFLADMGERPAGLSLDRIDNNGNYEPGNCRWATPKEQSSNREGTRLIAWQGETLCVKEWSRRTGVSNATILCRLARGLPPERVFERPAFIPPTRDEVIGMLKEFLREVRA
jgi:hypothetical protein